MEGVQFAELNCEKAGALYQDVLTIPGEPLNYYLSHRARGVNNRETEYDTMFLVIMPTKDSQNLTTQSQLENKLKELGVNIDQYDTSKEANQTVYEKNGILVVRITSDDQDWHSIDGTAGYTPTSSMTRFFFMAGKTAASIAGQNNGNTIGNFLDDVWFSQDLPKVADDEFSLEIKKEFEGLDSTGIDRVKDNIQFKVTVEGMDDADVADLLGLTSNTIKGSDMKLGVDQSLTYSIVKRKIDSDAVYQVKITESKAELDGYSMISEAHTTIVDGDNEPEQSDGQIFELKGKTTAYVTFTNTYDRSENKTVNFTKIWDDGDRTEARPSNLTVTLKPTILVEENGVLVEKELTGENLGISLDQTITASNDWKASWDVPVYYEYNGAKVKIEYTVVEGEIGGSYVYEANSTEGIPYDGNDTGYTSQFVNSGITPEDNQSSQKASSRAKALKAGENQSSTEELGEPNHHKYWEDLKDCAGISHFEAFIRRGLKDGLPVRSLPEYLKKENPDVIIVCREVGCGIVPMDAFEREYRETVGRVCTELAAMSEEVHRVLCGVGTVIKG